MTHCVYLRKVVYRFRTQFVAYFDVSKKNVDNSLLDSGVLSADFYCCEVVSLKSKVNSQIISQSADDLDESTKDDSSHVHSQSCNGDSTKGDVDSEFEIISDNTHLSNTSTTTKYTSGLWGWFSKSEHQTQQPAQDKYQNQPPNHINGDPVSTGSQWFSWFSRAEPTENSTNAVHDNNNQTNNNNNNNDNHIISTAHPDNTNTIEQHSNDDVQQHNEDIDSGDDFDDSFSLDASNTESDTVLLHFLASMRVPASDSDSESLDESQNNAKTEDHIPNEDGTGEWTFI